MKPQALIVLLCLQYRNGLACTNELCLSISNYENPSENEGWLVERAALRDEAKHKQMALLVNQNRNVWLEKDKFFPRTGHMLHDGKGDILIYKQINPGFSWASDRGHFFQITIMTQKSLVGSGKLRVGGSSGVTIFYTSGNPAFHNYCFGYASKGSLSYSSTTKDPDNWGKFLFEHLGINGKGLLATISAEFVTINSKGVSEVCRPCLFSANLLFKPNDIITLNKELEPFEERSN